MTISEKMFNRKHLQLRLKEEGRHMIKKKSIHELAKEYPYKTYRDLEKYREAHRWEEAIGIGHNHPPSPIEENKDK